MKLIRSLTSGGVLMALALVLGVGTAGATFLWLDQQAAASGDAQVASAESPRPTQDVVVVLADVAAGTRLPKSALGVRRVAVDEVLVGALTNLDDVVDRVSRYPLFSGEQVTGTKLVARDAASGAGLAFTVPAGMRAVSVSVNEVTGAGGLILPGDRVDVMVATEHARVFGPSTTSGNDNLDRQPTVVTVLQDVLVLAVGQELAGQSDGRDPAAARTEESAPQPRAASVTLAATPADAQVLFMASQEGPLGFAVRSFGDGSRGALQPVTLVEPAAIAPSQVNSSN